MENPVQLTPHFVQAVDYARQVHVNLRKGTQVPYMAHLLGVASLALGETRCVPFPVTEDIVIKRGKTMRSPTRRSDRRTFGAHATVLIEMALMPTLEDVLKAVMDAKANALTGLPTKAQFVEVYRPQEPKMTWEQRAKAGVDANFQEALKADTGTSEATGRVRGRSETFSELEFALRLV